MVLALDSPAAAGHTEAAPVPVPEAAVAEVVLAEAEADPVGQDILHLHLHQRQDLGMVVADTHQHPEHLDQDTLESGETLLPLPLQV